MTAQEIRANLLRYQQPGTIGEAQFVDAMAHCMAACGARVVVGRDLDPVLPESTLRPLTGRNGHLTAPEVPAVAPEYSAADAKKLVDVLAEHCTALEMIAWAGYLRALADAKIAYQ